MFYGAIISFYVDILGGFQFGNTDFKSRLSYGGGGGGGGGSALTDDPNPGGKGGNGGGLVYLQVDELTLKGMISVNGMTLCCVFLIEKNVPRIFFSVDLLTK